MENQQLIKTQEKSLNEIAHGLKICLNELNEVVIRENNFLDHYKIDEVLRIIPIKLELLEQIENFENKLKEFKLKDELDNDSKNALITAHLELCDNLAVNYSKLDVAKSINQKIMNMISDRLIENKKQDHIYDSTGEVLSAAQEYKYMPPLTLNQKV